MSDVLDAEAFEISLRQWRACGEALLNRWDDIINEMNKLSLAQAGNRMYGKLISVFGGVLAVGGIVAAPFTGGVSAAVITLFGSGVSAVGGIVYNAAAIYEKVKENSKSDEISLMMDDFFQRTEGLLERYDASFLKSFKSNLMFALQNVLNSIPFAVPTTTATMTGAFSTVFKKSPPTSYFSPDPELKYKVFGEEYPANYVHNLCAAVCVFVLFVSILADINAIIDEKRIVDGRDLGKYIKKLHFLRSELQTCLMEGFQVGCALHVSVSLNSDVQETGAFALQ
ncbi:uncharacterized protein LOC124282211 [Haliotis rubra]|uniref:uncharacterized protein LOC124282211 n=1 Tax=Haliotis rubra TaxID=36100 RepID=UPI001EE57D27|nr:uncharacterized protein LOC124282211 [Haliotis rubra]